MASPDDSLDKLTTISKSSMLLASDADMFVHGTALAFLRRVAPEKPVIGLCADRPKLQREARVALRFPEGNASYEAFYEMMKLAIRAARASGDPVSGYPARVAIQLPTKTAIYDHIERLRKDGLWNRKHCKYYHGASTNKDDFQNTESAYVQGRAVACASRTSGRTP